MSDDVRPPSQHLMLTKLRVLSKLVLPAVPEPLQGQQHYEKITSTIRQRSDIVFSTQCTATIKQGRHPGGIGIVCDFCAGNRASADCVE